MALEELEILVGQLLLPGPVGVEVVAQRPNDEPLNLGGGKPADQSGRLGLSLQHGIIAVARAAPVGMAWAHAVAANVKQAPAQDGG
jgi:hypothetical protein